MSLREITKELHHEAETTKAAKALLSGKISKEDYRKYIYQLLLILNNYLNSGFSARISQSLLSAFVHSALS